MQYAGFKGFGRVFAEGPQSAQATRLSASVKVAASPAAGIDLFFIPVLQSPIATVMVLTNFARTSLVVLHIRPDLIQSGKVIHSSFRCTQKKGGSTGYPEFARLQDVSIYRQHCLTVEIDMIRAYKPV